MSKEKETFEALYAALEEKARRLEEGGLTLEESVKTYEEGAEIAMRLRELLDQTELRVRELDSKLDGAALQLQEFEVEYDPAFDDAESDD